MLLKRAQLENKDFVDIPQNSDTLKLLDLFEKHGFILGFEVIITKPVIRVYFRGDYSMSGPFLDIKYFSQKTQKSVINKRRLLLLVKKYPSKFFIIHTRVGLLSHQECLNLNIFGFLFLKL